MQLLNRQLWDNPACYLVTVVLGILAVVRAEDAKDSPYRKVACNFPHWKNYSVWLFKNKNPAWKWKISTRRPRGNTTRIAFQHFHHKMSRRLLRPSNSVKIALCKLFNKWCERQEFDQSPRSIKRNSIKFVRYISKLCHLDSVNESILPAAYERKLVQVVKTTFLGRWKKAEVRIFYFEFSNISILLLIHFSRPNR